MVRMIAFTLEPCFDPSWFESVAGQEPAEERKVRARGLHRSEGTFLQGQLVLESFPDKFQFLYRASQDDAQKTPYLGSAPDAWRAFQEQLLPFFRSKVCPPVHRVGFGSACIIEVSDRREGYICLQRFLPAVTVDADGSEDIIYRINRPRVSATSGEALKINRVCTWMVPTRTTLLVPASPGPQQGTLLTDSATTCLSVELDINSDQNRTSPIAPARVVQVLQESVQMAGDILQRGDVP